MAGLLALIGIAIAFGFAAVLVAKAITQSSSRTRSDGADPTWNLWNVGDGGSSDSSHDCSHGGDAECDGGGD